MKYFLIGIIASLLGIIIYLLWFAPTQMPDGKVLVSQTYLDSLASIADQPPEVIIEYDTVWNDTIIYEEKEPPAPIDEGESYTYTDSLITPDISIWLWDNVSKKGIITKREWAYRLHTPYYITESKTIFQPVPKPYPVYVEREYQRNPRIRYYGMAGWGNLKSLDGGIIFNDKYIGGLTAGIMGGEAVFQAKVGILF